MNKVKEGKKQNRIDVFPSPCGRDQGRGREISSKTKQKRHKLIIITRTDK